ncbi:hypothetical protein DAERI_050119 [Deinococcus aerius]|uniref:Uncharacterized protein n=1 Tax=Deinococcus aerius TaxID=200253 RepID=A0A2I9D5H9_9DEIO|nr:hypothetical protein DAERI_050119 [Deinococcus aerius]
MVAQVLAAGGLVGGLTGGVTTGGWLPGGCEIGGFVPWEGVFVLPHAARVRAPVKAKPTYLNPFMLYLPKGSEHLVTR